MKRDKGIKAPPKCNNPSLNDFTTSQTESLLELAEDGENNVVVVVVVMVVVTVADLVVLVIVMAAEQLLELMKGVVLIEKIGDGNVNRTRNSKGLSTKNQQLDPKCNRKFNKQ